MPLEERFKPYKGVSSNFKSLFGLIKNTSFKPYKGVSSNHGIGFCLSSLRTVSNPIREYLQINQNELNIPSKPLFQTL